MLYDVLRLSKFHDPRPVRVFLRIRVGVRCHQSSGLPGAAPQQVRLHSELAQLQQTRAHAATTTHTTPTSTTFTYSTLLRDGI